MASDANAQGRKIINALAATAASDVPIFSQIPVVAAGTGITITGTPTAPVVNNAGVLSVTAGTNVTITGTATAPVVNANSQSNTASVAGYFSGAIDTDRENLAPATADSNSGGNRIEWAWDFDTQTINIDFLIRSAVVVGTDVQAVLSKNDGASSTNLFTIANGFTGIKSASVSMALLADTDHAGLSLVAGTSAVLEFSWSMHFLPT